MRQFSDRLPLGRVAVDRDPAGRAGGLGPLLEEPSARALVLHDGRALLARPGRLALLPVGDVPDRELAVYLGRALADAPDLAAGGAVVLFVVSEPVALALGSDAGDWADLRRTGATLGERDTALFAEALALANWHRAYGFSPRSGAATEVVSSGWVRRDPVSGAEFFPRTDPAVIMGVTDADDRMLLGSNALWEANRFSLLAGFVEPGESLEAAVVREVREEAGLRVVDPHYLGSQPWPFPASIMLGFRARLAEDESPDPRPDGEEIRELRWFTREQLASAVGEILLPGPISIARAIIEDWYGAEIPDGSRG